MENKKKRGLGRRSDLYFKDSRGINIFQGFKLPVHKYIY
jgi:hypothetical protein